MRTQLELVLQCCAGVQTRQQSLCRTRGRTTLSLTPMAVTSISLSRCHHWRDEVLLVPIHLSHNRGAAVHACWSVLHWRVRVGQSSNDAHWAWMPLRRPFCVQLNIKATSARVPRAKKTMCAQLLTYMASTQLLTSSSTSGSKSIRSKMRYTLFGKGTHRVLLDWRLHFATTASITALAVSLSPSTVCFRAFRCLGPSGL